MPGFDVALMPGEPMITGCQMRQTRPAAATSGRRCHSGPPAALQGRQGIRSKPARWAASLGKCYAQKSSGKAVQVLRSARIPALGVLPRCKSAPQPGHGCGLRLADHPTSGHVHLREVIQRRLHLLKHHLRRGHRGLWPPAARVAVSHTLF